VGEEPSEKLPPGLSEERRGGIGGRRLCTHIAYDCTRNTYTFGPSGATGYAASAGRGSFVDLIDNAVLAYPDPVEILEPLEFFRPERSGVLSQGSWNQSRRLNRARPAGGPGRGRKEVTEFGITGAVDQERSSGKTVNRRTPRG
jgi:hypothetical protein